MWRAVPALWMLPACVWAAQIVEGRVVNAANGVGIAGVNVVLMGGEDPYRVTTDSEGRFRIEGVADGSYRAIYRARGFWMLPRSSPQDLPQFTVTGKGGPVHLEASLAPIPKVSGRVLNSLGKPVPNATVLAQENPMGCNKPSCFGPAKEVKTGEKGEYSIEDFAGEGRWVLSAIAPESLAAPDSGAGWTQTFYPSTADPQLAARITVQSGVEQSGLDIKLVTAAVHYIRGKVLDAQGDPARVTVSLYNGLGWKVEKVTESDGKFEMGPAPEGQWQVSAVLEGGGKKLWALERVELKDRDAENVELRLAAPFLVHGKVIWNAPEGVSPPERLPDVVMAYKGNSFDSPNSPRTPVGRPDNQGGVTFEDVYPGEYEFAFLEGPPSPFYLESIRYGAQDALTSFVRVAGGDQTVEFTFRYGGGTVQGTVQDCGDAHVVLLPQDPPLRRPGLLHETKCEANGHFEFSGVRPGEYYGIAIGGEGAGQWFTGLSDDRVLRQAGRVTVRANEHTSAEIPLVRR